MCRVEEAKTIQQQLLHEKYGVRTIAPEENCPPRLGSGFGLGLALGLGLGGTYALRHIKNICRNKTYNRHLQMLIQQTNKF